MTGAVAIVPRPLSHFEKRILISAREPGSCLLNVYNRDGVATAS